MVDERGELAHGAHFAVTEQGGLGWWNREGGERGRKRQTESEALSPDLFQVFLRAGICRMPDILRKQKPSKDKKELCAVPESGRCREVWWERAPL